MPDWTPEGITSDDGDAHVRFEPVPLPSLAPGELTVARLEPVLRDWVSSPPLRALAESSGWDWPGCSDTGELLARLASSPATGLPWPQGGVNGTS